MRVLFIHCTYRYKGGEDTVVLEELQLLQNNGIEARLLEFTNEKNSLLNLLQLPFNIAAYRRTRQTLQQYKPDVVHVHNVHFAASPSVLLAVQRQKIPIVMTLHNFRLLCPSAILYHQGKPFMYSLQQRFPWKATLAGVYKNSKMLTFWMGLSMEIHHRMKTWNIPDRYIVLSEHAKSIFLHSRLHFPSSKIVIKPNFCYAPKPVQASRSNHFLYVGRLTEEKGVRLLMQSFAKTGFPLIIAGNGPIRDEVINFSALHPNITFVGALQKEEVYEQLRRCTALVFPSVWYEGMPLTIIEAFACGTPVIASRLGAMETMITHHYNGLHFEAGSETSLSDTIKEWQGLTAEELAEYQKNTIATYNQFYTPEKNSEQLFNLYDSVITAYPLHTSKATFASSLSH